MTFKDIFPGLSRTKLIFKDFSGPGIFKKKSRTFHEAWISVSSKVGHEHQQYASD